MKSKIYIGIDPGKSGFITYFLSGEEIKYFPIPLIGKKIVDIKALDDFFKTLKALDQHYGMYCIIEDVHAMFGSSAKATFSFGHIVGVLEALIISNEIPFTKVAPKKWQKEMWEGIPMIHKPSSTGKTLVTDTKAMSEVAAKRIFPNEDLRKTNRSSKSDDNKVDSLLICEYCKRNFK